MDAFLASATEMEMLSYIAVGYKHVSSQEALTTSLAVMAHAWLDLPPPVVSAPTALSAAGGAGGRGGAIGSAASGGGSVTAVGGGSAEHDLDRRMRRPRRRDRRCRTWSGHRSTSLGV